MTERGILLSQLELGIRRQLNEVRSDIPTKPTGEGQPRAARRLLSHEWQHNCPEHLGRRGQTTH